VEPHEVTEVATLRQAEAVTVDDPAAVAFVVAPGAVSAQVAQVLRVLRRRVPLLRGQHPRQWCYTMSDWWTVAKSVVEECDCVLEVGGGEGPRAWAIRAAAAHKGVRVYSIGSLSDLRSEQVDAATIAVVGTGGDSTPHSEQVICALRGLGPSDTVRRGIASRGAYESRQEEAEPVVHSKGTEAARAPFTE
jgi:4-hydroxy-3-methylbut-2-enyl diphosphate reductase